MKSMPTRLPAPNAVDSAPRWYKRRWIRLYSIGVGSCALLTLVGWWVHCGNLFDLPIIHRPGRDKADYVREGDPHRVIVFIHGIFGDPEGTWTSPPDTYWPDLIAADKQFGNPDIYVAAYDTGLRNRMHLDEIAEGLYQRLRDAGVFKNHQKVILICHSLGGLMAERFLLKHRDLPKQIPLIYFYGTPQTGAQIARIGSVFTESFHDNSPSLEMYCKCWKWNCDQHCRAPSMAIARNLSRPWIMVFGGKAVCFTAASRSIDYFPIFWG